MGDFNLNEEINRLDSQLAGKQQISTMDLALVCNFCDKYIKSKTGMDILTIYEKAGSPADDVTRYLMFRFFAEPKILNLLNKYGITDLLATTLYSMGNKEIITINQAVIDNSNKLPKQMSIPQDSEQIKRIFRALRRNYELYQKLYKDKIWIVNTEITDSGEKRTSKIKISPYSFFHLMGFDHRRILNPNGKDRQGNSLVDNAKKFAAIFPDSEQAYKLLAEFGKEVNQYTLIELLLNREEQFLEAALNGDLAKVVNVDKLELRGYAFERMGLIESASGMILFDKPTALRLNHGNEVKFLSADIILLNDFLRKYDNIFGLDFVISPFYPSVDDQISDQQTVFLTRQPGGGFNSNLFHGQRTSVSTSVAGYRANDFQYSIREKGTVDGHPDIDPIDYREFSEEDRRRVEQNIQKLNSEETGGRSL